MQDDATKPEKDVFRVGPRHNDGGDYLLRWLDSIDITVKLSPVRGPLIFVIIHWLDSSLMLVGHHCIGVYILNIDI